MIATLLFALVATAPLRLHGIELRVPDVAATADRYARESGFRVVFGPSEDGGAVLEHDGVALVLRKGDAAAREPGVAGAFLDGARVGIAVESGADAERALAALGLAGALLVREGAAAPAPKGARAATILLAAEGLDAGLAALAAAGVAPDVATPFATPVGRAVLFRSSGVPFAIVERSPARLAFERFRSLGGAWRGKSTQGWTDRVSFETIARGSVVLETSAFDAHPGERMVTAFHMDGARFLLTHYCVAGNQPRLVATSFEDGGRKVTFEFESATNLASRDQGHMDKAVFEFDGEGRRFSSRWTWFQAGAEKWMETIVLERDGA